MADKAEFRSTRVSNLMTGVGLLALTGCFLFIIGFVSESEFLGTRARKSGIFKILEQAIGWEAFSFLMACFALWTFVYSFVHMWKGVDATPDVTAFPNHIEFHPAVRRTPAKYEDVSHWSIEQVSGHPVVSIFFEEPYWSLQGLVRRKTVKLEGSGEQLTPLVGYFVNHPTMSLKFVG